MDLRTYVIMYFGVALAVFLLFVTTDKAKELTNSQNTWISLFWAVLWPAFLVAWPSYQLKNWWKERNNASSGAS